MLNDFLREAMVVDAQTFLWSWVFSTVWSHTVLTAAIVVVVCLHRRLLEHLVAVADADGRWHLRRVPVMLLLAGMVWLHYGLDINPTVAAVCATSLVLMSLAAHPRVVRLPRPVLVAASLLVFAGCLLAARDIADRLVIAAWLLALVASQRCLASRLARAHLLLLQAAAVIPVNMLAAALPLYVTLHQGTHLGDGLAYCFCEVPGRGTVYATIPTCDSVRGGLDACGNSRIVEYDLHAMRPVASHAFFGPDFSGRPEQVVCLDDEVQVSIQGTIYRGQRLVQSAMSFPVDAPAKFTPVIAGAGVGNSIAYDEAHDALFYTGEFNNLVVRYDRRTKQFDDSLSRYFVHPWFHPFSLQRYTGSLMLYTNSIHPGRNRIYMAEAMHARYAYAIDLTTLQPVARYDVGGGGAMGITVDPERDRLYVSSLWGLEVFDLANDRLIARMRTGLGNRSVIVDRRRNRLYLNSMVEGKIRVLDRDTLEVINQIPIGIGSRFAYLTSDGKTFLASSAAAHYYWDADTLAPPRASGGH